MNNRVTNAQLEAIVKRINILTGSSITPYGLAKDDDGRYHACIGNYHLYSAYGKVGLHRMMNTSGGVDTVIGLTTKRELADNMYSFIQGLLTNVPTSH